MDEFTFQGNTEESFALERPNHINVILGRNGAGKSRFLRRLDQAMGNDETYRVRYVTPERGGIFRREGSVETNMSSNQNWANQTRRSNQASSFKSMSHVYLRNTESAYLRKLQDTDARGRSFQADCLEPINRMLSNVSIEQADPDFVFRGAHGDLIEADKLSSGESETIALASEVLNFIQNFDATKINVLLLDEPDVHQHPDLQARFGFYLLDQLESLNQDERSKLAICLATHSTPLVCSLASSAHTSVGTKEFDSDIVRLSPVSDQIKKVAPFFGHPLSLTLSRDPLLILEGEDDERVWQQAARSSQGRIRVFPVLAHSVYQQSDLESFSGPILNALYDEPVAYSLRDGDGISGELAAVGPVVRFRLQCYAIENALVTTECLTNLGVDWKQLQQLSESWLANNADHKDACALRKLIDSEDRLRNKKIKDIRQLIVSVAGSKKPWEVVVGQALAAIVGQVSSPDDPFSLPAFVGRDAAERLLHAVRTVENGI